MSQCLSAGVWRSPAVIWIEINDGEGEGDGARGTENVMEITRVTRLRQELDVCLLTD